MANANSSYSMPFSCKKFASNLPESGRLHRGIFGLVVTGARFSRKSAACPSPLQDDKNVIPPSWWRRPCAANMDSPGEAPGGGA
jgi:hypothetical protein